MATNMYVQFEDPAIAGTSHESGHEKQIEVLSWSHGFNQPTSPTRSTSEAGPASHSNLSFTKYLDAASNEILKHTWAGKQFGKVTLSAYRSDGARDNKPVKYLVIVMQHVILSNYAVTGGPGDIPVENISLDYGVINYEYVDQRGVSKTAEHDLRRTASA